MDVGLATTTADAETRIGRARRQLGSRLTLAHVAPLGLGVIATVLLLAGLKDRSAFEMVALADRAIAPGQVVSLSDVRWSSVHRGDGSLTAGLVDRNRLDGSWVSNVSIPAGAPIAAAELSPGLATNLGAMSIQLPPARADGGALARGDRVDVISVASGQAVFVAENLLVIAVAGGSGGVLGGVQDSSYYVTVAVDPPTALRIAAAQGVSAAGAGSQIELIRTAGYRSGAG